MGGIPVWGRRLPPPHLCLPDGASGQRRLPLVPPGRAAPVRGPTGPRTRVVLPCDQAPLRMNAPNAEVPVPEVVFTPADSTSEGCWMRYGAPPGPY